MKYLGIDYGTRRIGIALSDEEGRMAFPRMTVVAGPTALSDIAAIVKGEGVKKVVLGESRNLRGEPNLLMEDIEQFKRDLEELCAIPVVYESEIFSSAEAARQFTPDRSRRESPSQEKLDASAAALILQTYLDRHR